MPNIPPLVKAGGGHLSEIWVKGERVLGRGGLAARGQAPQPFQDLWSPERAFPEHSLPHSGAESVVLRGGNVGPPHPHTLAHSRDGDPPASAPCHWRGARALSTSSCACTHTCTCTEACCDVGHRLECLRPGVVRTEPSGRKLPDWTEMHPSLRLRPPLLACVNLTRSLSRLLFGFPRIPWLRLRKLTPSRGGGIFSACGSLCGAAWSLQKTQGCGPNLKAS